MSWVKIIASDCNVNTLLWDSVVHVTIATEGLVCMTNIDQYQLCADVGERDTSTFRPRPVSLGLMHKANRLLVGPLGKTFGNDQLHPRPP